VPLDGSGFRALSMSGLGVLDGQLYAVSNSVATNSPYVFSLTMRAPYLNPYNCQWATACQGNGPHGFWLEDGTPTSSNWTSPDGSGLIGLGNGRIKQVTTSGGYTELAASGGEVSFAGRPVRWTASSAPALATAGTSASGPQVLVVRADARASVLLTDPLGRRVGFDAAGAPVNDLGGRAQLVSGPGGWPRIIVLRDPDAGTFAAEIHAIDAGDWSVKAYLAHESGGGLMREVSGSAAAAGSELRGLHVGQPLELSWYASPAGVDDRDAAREGFVAVGPVPARDAVRFAYRVPAAGARVRLDVFDLLGRRVATPLDDAMPAGTHTLTWGGTHANGQRLARGIYVARLDLGGRVDARRIVLTD
jgi:FlgD Ig-like domain